MLTHVGRSSGNVYRVPLDAQPVDSGYLFILRYGSDSDWVKNVLAAGAARLKVGDEELELTSPRLITKSEASELLAPVGEAPATLRRANEFMQMDIMR